MAPVQVLAPRNQLHDLRQIISSLHALLSPPPHRVARSIDELGWWRERHLAPRELSVNVLLLKAEVI